MSAPIPLRDTDEPARRPACMDDADMAAWDALNRSTHGASRADSPCRDCLEAFRRDMLAEGRCDGEPLSEPAPNRGGRPPVPPLSREESRRRWREYRTALRSDPAVREHQARLRRENRAASRGQPSRADRTRPRYSVVSSQPNTGSVL